MQTSPAISFLVCRATHLRGYFTRAKLHVRGILWRRSVHWEETPEYIAGRPAGVIASAAETPPHSMKGRVMRENFTSEVETGELSDSALDSISGGTAGVSADVAGHGACVSVGDVAGAAQSLAATLPLSQVTGLVSVQTTGI
ncbi:hypothetical protein [Streptomyces sp. NPDC055287]